MKVKWLKLKDSGGGSTKNKNLGCWTIGTDFEPESGQNVTASHHCCPPEAKG